MGGERPREPYAPGQSRTIDLGNGITLDLVWIAPGTFTMGSPSSEADRRDDETQHCVTLSKGFWMGKYEITQEQWQALMGSNPSNFKGVKNPVELVSWDDCQEFIKRLNALVAATGGRGGPGAPTPATSLGSASGIFRLPTEAEWEYACQAKTTTFHYGNDLDASIANFNGNYPYGNGHKGEYRQKTVPVGSFKPNAFGLYDMHGNVWEWCQDWYVWAWCPERDGGYPSDSVTDPVGPGSGVSRVYRGGGWRDRAGFCRSAVRYDDRPGNRWDGLGLRLVRTE